MEDRFFKENTQKLFGPQDYLAELVVAENTFLVETCAQLPILLWSGKWL